MTDRPSMTMDGRGTPSTDRIQSLLGVQVLATGSYVPQTVVTNEDLGSRLGFDPHWIVQRTGIRERRHAAPHQATSDLCVEAAERCLAAAGAERGEVDLLVLATFSPDMPFPSTACLVQDRLGLSAPAFDLHAACAGFVYALVTGAQFVATGCCRRVLVMGGDCNSRLIDPSDSKTYPLFGDGAGAALLGPGDPHQGLIAYMLGADGSGAGALSRPMGGSRLPPSAEAMAQHLHYLQMDGRAVFKWAVRVLTDSVERVLAHAGMSARDLTAFVPHQANVRIINAAADVLAIPRERMPGNIERYGNTSAGSVPITLDEAQRAGKFSRGDTVLVSGFGAGLAWGTALLRW